METDVKVTVEDAVKRSADEDRLFEPCSVCDEVVPRPVNACDIMPELFALLQNQTFCSHVCAREFCRMLVQHSATQMGQVNTRFAKVMQ